MKRRLLGCSLIGCVALCLAWFNSATDTDAQTIENDRLEALQRRLEGTVRERAILKAVASQVVRSPADTTILRVLDDASRVKEGDVILELDSSLLDEQRAVTKVGLTSHQAAVALSRRTIDRLTRQQGLATSIAKQQARVIQLKQAAFAETRAKISDVTAAATSGELELAALQAELSAIQLTQSIDDKLAQSQVQLQAQLLEVAKTEGRLKRVSEQIKACTVRASAAGLVMYLTQSTRRTDPTLIEPGAAVRERQSLFQVFDPTKLQVEVRVHETRIAKVKLRQSVRIEVDALPTQTFNGTVVFVSPLPQVASWPNTDLKEYVVHVQLDSAPERMKGLRVGMTATAEIDVSK